MKEIARRLPRRVTYRLGYHNFHHFSLLPNSCLRETRHFFTVQLGANDGVFLSMIALIASHDIRRIDLLSTDAEECNSPIVLSSPFEIIQPAIILFEHGLRDHLMSEAAFLKVVTPLNRLHSNVLIADYAVIAHQCDRLTI